MLNTQKKNALHLSPVVAGMWRLVEWELTVAQRLELIERCIALGVTSFDHADIYGDYQCEALFGEAIRLAPALRQQMQLVSKCGIRLISSNRPQHLIKRYDTSYQHIVSSAENSLQQLNTDYLDCLLIHRPDPLMDAEEVARALGDLIQAGKILSAGVSNFLPHQVELLQSRCDFALVANQIEISVLQTQSLFDGSLDYCQQKKMLPMAWSPLSGGRLFNGESQQSIRVIGVLSQIADDIECTADQVALAWLMRHPAGIKPIVGSGNLDRIRTALEATRVTLQDEQWYAILQASQGRAVP